jgi:hypothetical protein
MSAQKRSEHSQDAKRIAFAEMAKTYLSYVAAGNLIGAHVIAFSFLEDRITAMDVVLGRTTGRDGSKYDTLYRRVNRLVAESDLSSDLASAIRAAADERNRLVHAAMWNLTAFSAEGANAVLALAREVDAARKRQKTRRRA